ncbi:acetylglutamate kinase [Jatrophihabitans sp.]|jgi:acetylglutamate/LysW-gamma-L-alpha-aminoadipate kinase|uniref:acetylglutamate kinase n=1 Tax=Jatrophihabitans sp. TaxID=1932789 RepID=UPI002F15B369
MLNGHLASTVVVKCGGVVSELPEPLCADLADRHRKGERLLLVHGGASDIDRIGGQLGVRQRRLIGPGGVSGRYTDPETMAVVTMALAGVVKPRLVEALVRHGVPAIGLTGLDAGLVTAVTKKPFRARLDDRSAIIRDDRSGRITAVNSTALHRLLDAGFLPVLSPPAFGADGALNVDADRLAAAVAAAMGAQELVLLSDVPGVLENLADRESVLARCSIPADGRPPVSGGGMGAKLTAAHTALVAGVRVRIFSGLVPAPLSKALAGHGTEVVLEP